MEARVSRTIVANGMITNRVVGMIQYLGCVQSGSTLIQFKPEAKIIKLSSPSIKMGMEATLVSKVERALSSQELAQKADATPRGTPSSATITNEYVNRRTV